MGLLAASSARAATGEWDFKDDFVTGSAATNPSGAWSYRAENAFGDRSVLQGHTDSGGSGGTISGWYGFDAFCCAVGFPLVGVSGSPPSAKTGVIVQPSNQSRAVIAWTSPVSGTVEVSGSVFLGVAAQFSNGVDWSLHRSDGAVLAAGTQLGPDPRTSFSAQTHVSVGDVLYYSEGARGDFGNDGASVAFHVRLLDTSPPQLTVTHAADGQAGWNVSAPVQLTVAAADSETGLAGAPACTDGGAALAVAGSSSPNSATVSGEGPHPISCSVTDRAGNTTTVADEVKIDTTAPAVSVISPAAGASFELGSIVPLASCATEDTGSGTALTATATTAGGNASGVGTFTVTCAGAIDVAGNMATSAIAEYTVTFPWTGFYQPVDNKDASGRYILNKAKAGSTIPIKFNLGGDRGLDILATGSPSSGVVGCDTAATTDALEEYATNTTSGLKYDSTTDRYIYNWKTASAWSGSCRQLVLELKDGTKHRASFLFTK
jgi:hypothetical protein